VHISRNSGIDARGFCQAYDNLLYQSPVRNLDTCIVCYL